MSTAAQTHFEEFQPPKRALWTLRLAIVGLGALILWASVSKIDQVTRAQGQIIASAKTQEIQAPDNGVVTRLHVKEGDRVKAGQLLATLEKERAEAAVADSTAKVAALKIALARLRAEVYGQAMTIDPDLRKWTEYVQNQTQLYAKRRQAIDQDVASLQRMLVLAEKELKMNEGLEASGDVSRGDILRLQRQVADIQAQITNKRNKYFQDAQAEMTKAQEELNTQVEALRDRTQVLEHTELTAPMAGIVKNIKVTTAGGVVRGGDTIMQILPVDSDLVAEVKVSPADVAFVHEGSPAYVKLDAYDFSIFGAMRGEVAYVSPDTLTEETRTGPQPYYRVNVHIHAAEFEKSGARELRIRPGMTATVDIKARERTVLSYLTKPIIKTLSQSMGER